MVVPARSVLSRTTLRVRLILAILFATLPLLAVIWFGAHRQSARESANLEQEVVRLTAFVAGDLNSLFEATRRMLMAVDGISRIADDQRRRVLLDDLASRCPYYEVLGVVTVGDGTNLALCAEDRTRIRVGEAVLRRAEATRKLVVGREGPRSAGRSNLLCVAYCDAGVPATNRSTVAFAVFDMGWLDNLLTEERVKGNRSLFPRDMVLNILDRSGLILTRYPEMDKWAGKRFPDSKVLHEIIDKGAGLADLTGVSGLRRLYAFQTVEAVSGDLIVSVGVSREAVLAASARDSRKNLAAVSCAGLLLMVLAWFGSGFFITRPVSCLVNAARRLGSGDLSTRTGLTSGPREITRLAEVFDGMAETLEQDARKQAAMQEQIAAYDRQLRSLAVEAALAEEQERRQIAMGLHDRTGPLLATCGMHLGRVLRRGVSPESAATLTETRGLIDQAIAELRTLTFDLSSPTLYTLGLRAAVEELCRVTAQHHAVAIAFQDQGTPDNLPNDDRVVLYQAARELLFNVLKHAEASHVTVTCGGDAEEVFVAVEDDGVGFDGADAGHGFSRTGGFGLFHLRERLTHLGGRLQVRSLRGRGTRVVAALPAGGGEERGEASDGDPGVPD